jgi:hypothetical protein
LCPTHHTDEEGDSVKVWLAIYIDGYNGDFPEGVYVSREAAVASIKKKYAPPYIVKWRQKRVRGGWDLIGSFEHVQHYSTKHEGTHFLQEYEVEA